MNAADHISQDDLALLALQLLPEDEAAAMFAHVRVCELCREELAAFQGDLAVYSLSAEQYTPPAGAQERLMRSISAGPRAASSAFAEASGPSTPQANRTNEVLVMPQPEERRTRTFLKSYLGWAVAAMFAFATGFQYVQRQQLQNEVTNTQHELAALQLKSTTSQAAMSTLTDPAAVNVALSTPSPHAGTSPAPEGRAAYLPDRGALVFVANHLEKLEPNKVYELWLLPAAKDMTPVPAASFRPDATGKATVVVPAGPRLVEIKGFGVTQELDRSAPKQPTLPILLVGTSKS